MTYDELNNYIFDYTMYDRTGRAIMLSGEWGTGKSFYVKNVLKPFFESKQEDVKCVIVSLYGLTNLSEISKAIYMELRTVIPKASSEAGNTAMVVGKIVGKTILNGLGVDIASITDKDLQAVYESIDLKNKLIVFEDIERTKIDVIDLLGYINNLCENDGIKVLIVTDETKMLATEEKTGENGTKISVYTEKAVEYKAAKEKTIGDTIKFECDYNNTILQIIDEYSLYLKKFATQETAAYIHLLFLLLRSNNLRAFIFACEKAKNIFEYVEKEKIHISEEIEKIIFYGIIGFTQRQSKYGDLFFDHDMYLSPKLGINDEYPLFRFCYDYIVFQNLDKKEITNADKYYTEYRLNGKWNSGKDKDLKIIKFFFENTEKDVITAVDSIAQKIKNADIPYCDYGGLVDYLLAIKYEADIDFDMLPIENAIIDSLTGMSNEIEYESLFNSSYTLHQENALTAQNEIRQKIKNVLRDVNTDIFIYNPDKIGAFYEKNEERLKNEIHNKGFLSLLDLDLLVEMLKKCSSAQIGKVRTIFIKLYKDMTYSEIKEEDLFAFGELCDKITPLQEYEKYDKIQKMQIRIFIKFITDIMFEENK